MTTNALCYLAAPYSNADPSVRERRFEAANKVAGILMRRGELAFSPLSHSHPIALAGELPLGWDYWQAFDRAILAACKRVVVLCIDGWRESVGITAELEIARDLGLPVSYVDENGEEVTP